MADFNEGTPKATGAIDSVSGAVITVKNVTPASNWVGRLIYLTSGNGRYQYREIIAVSGQDVTVYHPFNKGAYLLYPEVDPASDDTFSISYTMDEMVAKSNSFTTKVKDNHYQINPTSASNEWRLNKDSNVVVYYPKGLLDWNSEFSSIRRNTAFIVGKYNYRENRDPVSANSVSLLDLHNGGNRGLASSSNSDTNGCGNIEIYASINCYTSVLAFVYGFTNQTSDAFLDACRIRIIADIHGSWGGRFAGRKGIFWLKTYDNDNSTTINVVADVPDGAVRIGSRDMNTLAYNWLQYAPSRLYIDGVDNVENMMKSFAGTYAGNVEVVCRQDELLKFTRITTTNSITDANSNLHIGEMVYPKVLDKAGSAITKEIKFEVYDNTGTEISKQSTTNPTANPTPVFCPRYKKASITVGLQLSGMTNVPSYQISTSVYGYNRSYVTNNMHVKYETTTLLLMDTNISEADSTVVSAYNKLDTLSEIYDAIQLYKHNNTAKGGLDKELCTVVGDTLTLIDGYALTLDKGATDNVVVDDATKVITLKADLITEGAVIKRLAVQGAVSFDSDEAISVLYTDSNADSIIKVDGGTYKVYANQSDAQQDTNSLGSSDSNGIFRFLSTTTNLNPTDTVVLRLVIGSTISFKNLTLIKGINIVVFSQSEILNNILEQVNVVSTKTDRVKKVADDNNIKNKQVLNKLDTQEEHISTVNVEKNDDFPIDDTAFGSGKFTQTGGSRGGLNGVALSHDSTDTFYLDIPVSADTYVDKIVISDMEVLTGNFRDFEIKASLKQRGINGSKVIATTNYQTVSSGGDNLTRYTFIANTHHLGDLAYTEYVRVRFTCSSKGAGSTFRIGKITLLEHSIKHEKDKEFIKANVVQVNGTDVTATTDFHGDTTAITTAIAGVSTKVDANKTVIDSTKTVVDSTKTVVDATKTVVDSTKTVADSTKTVLDASKVVIDASKVVIDATKGVVDNNYTKLDNNKAVLDSTKTVVDSTKVVVDTHTPIITTTKDTVIDIQDTVNELQIQEFKINKEIEVNDSTTGVAIPTGKGTWQNGSEIHFTNSGASKKAEVDIALGYNATDILDGFEFKDINATINAGGTIANLQFTISVELQDGSTTQVSTGGISTSYNNSTVDVLNTKLLDFLGFRSLLTKEYSTGTVKMIKIAMSADTMTNAFIEIDRVLLYAHSAYSLTDDRTLATASNVEAVKSEVKKQTTIVSNLLKN